MARHYETKIANSNYSGKKGYQYELDERILSQCNLEKRKSELLPSVQVHTATT